MKNNFLTNQSKGQRGIPDNLGCSNTDIVESERTPLSKKLKKKYFNQKIHLESFKIQFQNTKKEKLNSSPFGPKISTMARVQILHKETDEIDSCNYTEEIKIEEKNYIFQELPLPLSPEPFNQRKNFGDTSKKFSSWNEEKQNYSKNNKDFDFKSREPSLSRNSRGRLKSHKSNKSGFTEACKSAYKEIIEQKKEKLKTKKELKILKGKLEDHLDSRFAKSSKHLRSPENSHSRRQSILSCKIGFIDDPFFEKLDYDKKGYIVVNRGDRSKKSTHC